jgi:nucleotide-binding universal stress UspA family protein
LGITSRKERILRGSYLDVHVQTCGRAINPLEAMMPLTEESRRATNDAEERALLYVTDSVSDSPEFLAFALKMAERHGTNLELLQVVDPGQASSNPDAHMGVQYSLETLARSLKALKRNAHALLLFGHPEAVISRRAADIKATVIAFPLDGSARDRSKKNLARRLIQRCACPVLTFSLFPGTAKRTGEANP